MLTKCPECELQVSDKAVVCPHCGYPLKERPYNPSRPKKAHKRLPNGFGQITEIKGKYLRKPWRAMVTVGKTSTGQPICKILKPEGYFETYNEAYTALIEYNKNPYDLDDDVTVKELYDKWSTEYFKSLKSDSSVRTIESAWAYCSSVEKMRVKDVRARHIKAVMDEGEYNGHTPSNSTKDRIKSLFNLMLDYAVEYELVDRNYARTFKVSDEVLNGIEEAKRQHLSFTDEEMQKLWANRDATYVGVVLVQCYMGWRPQELGLLETVNVDLKNWTIIGGMKTDAGKDRVVPIHPCIRDIIKDWYDPERKYLFHATGVSHKGSDKLTYDKYSYRFKKIVEELGLNPEHRPHDPRKQFVTMCKKYNVDEYAIKKMVGHETSDITEAVYTDRDDEWLMREIMKIEVDKN